MRDRNGNYSCPSSPIEALGKAGMFVDTPTFYHAKITR